MSSSQPPTPPADGSSTDGNTRKRVCKACDRCRLKKSKCDGSNPCSRCKADNAICFFGERKKTQDRVYPKGYVEMLEQQQAQLVAGLQEMYKRMLEGQGWIGCPLSDPGSGQPLTHDILDRLGLLKHDRKSDSDTFEEDFSVLQKRLYESGAPPMLRNKSFSSISEQGQLSPVDSAIAQPLVLNEIFRKNQAPPTPPENSPFPTASTTRSSFLPTSPPMRPSDGNTSDVQARTDIPQAEDDVWSGSNFLDDGMNFLHKYQSSASYSPVDNIDSDLGAAPSMTFDWRDDEEFKAFFHSAVD